MYLRAMESQPGLQSRLLDRHPDSMAVFTVTLNNSLGLSMPQVPHLSIEIPVPVPLVSEG